MIKSGEELLRLQEENKQLRDGIAKAREKIELYKADCDLSVDEYLGCRDCNENVFKTIFGIIDAITEGEEIICQLR